MQKSKLNNIKQMWFYLYLKNLILARNSPKSAPLNGRYPKLQFPTYIWFSHAQSHVLRKAGPHCGRHVGTGTFLIIILIYVSRTHANKKQGEHSKKKSKKKEVCTRRWHSSMAITKLQGFLPISKSSAFQTWSVQAWHTYCDEGEGEGDDSRK